MATALVGKNGWLFLTDDGNDVIGQYEGRVRLTRENSDLWRRLLAKRAEAFAARGLPYHVFVAPNKEIVYREELPAQVLPGGERPIARILANAREAGVEAHYLLEALEGGKSRRIVYSQTDTHWTDWGAYLGYRAICAGLNGLVTPHSVVAEDELAFRSVDYCGDLGNKLDPPRAGPHIQVAFEDQRGRLLSDNLIRNHGRKLIFERPDSGLLSAVVLGDSFSYHLLIYLKETFRRLVFVHTHSLPWKLVDEETPDLVLSLMVERFLIRPPDDRRADEELRTTVKQKRAEGAVSAGGERYLASIPRPGQAPGSSAGES